MDRNLGRNHLQFRFCKVLIFEDCYAGRAKVNAFRVKTKLLEYSLKHGNINKDLAKGIQKKKAWTLFFIMTNKNHNFINPKFYILLIFFKKSTTEMIEFFLWAWESTLMLWVHLRLPLFPPKYIPILLI